MRCKKKEVRTDSLWTDTCQGKKSEKKEIELRSTPTQKRQCLPRLSVRVCPSCVWVEGGVYFQVELTRTETLVDTAQQATTSPTTTTPGADGMQNSGLRTQSPRTGADRGWRVAPRLRTVEWAPWVLGQAGRAEVSDPVREEEGSTVWACRDDMGSPPPPASLSQDVPVPQLPGAGGC